MRKFPVTATATIIFAHTLLFQAAHSQDVTPDEIVRALLPDSPKTRSLRGISVEPGKEAPPPKIDLQVNFEFDSAKLTNEALLTLRTLGEALQDDRLKTYNFLIVGHTDAKGTDTYNMALSERRAAAVRNQLSFYYDIPADRLASMGQGESHLAYPDDPENALNRRVEIRNVSK